MTRKHSLFPTREETLENPEIAYSDHLAIFTTVPLDEKNSLNIISLNVLGQSCSGIHSLAFNEKDEETEHRYDRIVAGLVEGIKRQEVDVLVLQEASLLMEAALKRNAFFDEHWEIVADQVGIISCYNKERLTLNATKLNEERRIRTLTFLDKITELTIDVHNVWRIYSPFPRNMEVEFKEVLENTESAVSVILGDTNSRIAPLDEEERNITTGTVPATFNVQDGLDEALQITDHPDGGFYRDALNVIRQLVTRVINFATGEFVEDDRPHEETQTWPEFRMVLCLDDSYQKRQLIDNKTIFAYEEYLKEGLKEPSILVSMASDSYNNKAIGIRFAKNSSTYNWVKEQLKNEEGFQFNSVQPTD